MKSLKICSLVALMLLALVGCNKNKEGQGTGNNNNNNPSSIVNQWCLTSWDEQAPEFNVYLQFKADGSFDIYQQVWNLTYDHFNGTYTTNGDIVSGTYANGDSWACGYRFEVVDGLSTESLYHRFEDVLQDGSSYFLIPIRLDVRLNGGD
jgi:hypothetical protein